MTSDKVRIGMAAAALLGLGLAAQGGPQAKPDKPAQGASSPAVVPMPKSDRLAMADFKKLLATGEVVVIDVRSNSAYVGGHIPGALSMPVETINSATAEKLKRLGKKVATYCA